MSARQTHLREAARLRLLAAGMLASIPLAVFICLTFLVLAFVAFLVLR